MIFFASCKKMPSDLFSLLTGQFDHCMEILKTISDDEKAEAVKYMETALQGFDKKLVKVENNEAPDWLKLSKDVKVEYVENDFKEEEVQPDISKVWIKYSDREYDNKNSNAGCSSTHDNLNQHLAMPGLGSALARLH